MGAPAPGSPGPRSVGLSASAARRAKTTAHAGAGGGPVGPRLPAGLSARELAVAALDAILHRGITLDEAMASALSSPSWIGLEARDRAFARLLVTSVLRHCGSFDAVLARFLAKPLPREQRRLRLVLQVASAQLLLLTTPPHAAISLAVEQAKRTPRTRHLAALTNAVLRRVAADGRGILAGLDGTQLDIPAWLRSRWTAAYGAQTAGRIARASLTEPLLDLSVKAEPASWAARLGGFLLATGGVRLAHSGRIEEIEGYEDGGWWVQDAAASLPARLLGDVAGLRVLDLCAAPGGKTAELAAAGARVTAVDVSEKRLDRMRANLARLALGAELVVADAADWAPGTTFDAVLLDAPCSATGTIRRHPDILRMKREEDILRLAAEQRRLIDNALRLVAPGGHLVYATCSLEPEEGPAQIAALGERDLAVERVPLTGAEAARLGLAAEWIDCEGSLRTLPFQTPSGAPEGSGMDGFFAARLRRRV